MLDQSLGRRLREIQDAKAGEETAAEPPVEASAEPPPPPAPPARKPLGRLLVEKGALSEEDLEVALERQRTEGGPLGQILLGMGAVTEQNLARVFDAAEQAQAVLLFDEADALFGRRTEVSDARDRYANLETAYLLSRMERFEGLTVLATNLRQNLDPAFIRRLEFVLDFEEPSLREREALWRAHLPPGAPLAADVDLHALAVAYPLVGALIRNAAVGAAFLAAAGAQDAAISTDHLTAAVRREYQKAGRAFPGAPGTRATRST